MTHLQHVAEAPNLALGSEVAVLLVDYQEDFMDASGTNSGDTGAVAVAGAGALGPLRPRRLAGARRAGAAGVASAVSMAVDTLLCVAGTQVRQALMGIPSNPWLQDWHPPVSRFGNSCSGAGARQQQPADCHPD